MSTTYPRKINLSRRSGAQLPRSGLVLGVMVDIVATLIHFTISITCAALLALSAARLNAIPVLLTGVSFGVALYVVNLYGSTAISPWFVQARGWITLIILGIFGLTAISVYRWLDVSNVRSSPDAR